LGVGRSDPDDPGFLNRFRLLQVVQDNLRDGLRFVDDDDPDGIGAFAAQREVGDVHAVAAQDRADLADDARLIVVPDDDPGPSRSACRGIPFMKDVA
jgi:hypothetical protein